MKKKNHYHTHLKSTNVKKEMYNKIKKHYEYKHIINIS